MKKYQVIYIGLSLFLLAACQKAQITDPTVYNCTMTITDESASHPKAVEFQAALDKIITYLPGVQASILTPDGKQWTGAAGMADIPNQVAMQPCHKLMVGSVSKIFTGVMILQLQEAGILSIEDKLSDWLDQDLIGDVENANEVTIRQLLNHTTGIYDYLDVGNHFDAINKPFYQLTQREKIALIHGKKADHAVGAQFTYSNSNYVLLGLVIEVARNMPLWDAVRKFIVEPIGLENTVMGTHEKPIPEGTARPYLAVADYQYFDIMQNSVADAATGDGGIAASMQDLILFMNAIMNSTLLTAESFEQMKNLTVSDGDDDQYGLGLEIADIDGYGIGWGHGGSTSAYNTFLLHFPERNGTIAFVFNGRFDKQEVNDKIGELWDELLSISFD